jgi:hypothetical protein
VTATACGCSLKKTAVADDPPLPPAATPRRLVLGADEMIEGTGGCPADGTQDSSPPSRFSRAGLLVTGTIPSVLSSLTPPPSFYRLGDLLPWPHPSLDAAQQQSILFRRDLMRPLSAEWLGFVELVDLSSDPLLQILFDRVADTVTAGIRVYLPSSFIPTGI